MHKLRAGKNVVQASCEPMLGLINGISLPQDHHLNRAMEKVSDVINRRSVDSIVGYMICICGNIPLKQYAIEEHLYMDAKFTA